MGVGRLGKLYFSGLDGRRFLGLFFCVRYEGVGRNGDLNIFESKIVKELLL